MEVPLSPAFAIPNINADTIAKEICSVFTVECFVDHLIHKHVILHYTLTVGSFKFYCDDTIRG